MASSPVYVTRLLAASSLLQEPAKSLFERVFLRGDNEEVVRHELRLSADAFAQVRSSMLRTLMAASR